MSEDDAKICTVIRVEAGNPGIDAQAWAALLRRMYLRWADSEGIGHYEGQGNIVIFAPPFAFDNERGVHRLVRKSPFDHQDRRHTTFAAVSINGDTADEQARSYVLHPYTLVQDHRTEIQREDVQAVLDGNLGWFLAFPDTA